MRRPHGRPAGSVDRCGRALPVLGIDYARSKAAMHLGDAIRIARERVDVAAQELADRLEISRSTVLKWERGDSCPSIAQLLRVAWALGCPFASLLEEVE